MIPPFPLEYKKSDIHIRRKAAGDFVVEDSITSLKRGFNANLVKCLKTFFVTNWKSPFKIAVLDEPIYLRLKIEGRAFHFEWSYDGETYTRIEGDFETPKFSDEFCKYGEFTGTFVGMTCADWVMHKHYADFDFFEYVAEEEKPVG